MGLKMLIALTKSGETAIRAVILSPTGVQGTGRKPCLDGPKTGVSGYTTGTEPVRECLSIRFAVWMQSVEDDPHHA